MKTDQTCPHPPHRLFSWVAYDGTLVIACSECGACLQGGTDDPPQDISDSYDAADIMGYGGDHIW